MSVDWNGFVTRGAQLDLIRAIGERDSLAQAVLGLAFALEACMPVIAPLGPDHVKALQSIIDRSRAMADDAVKWTPAT